MNEEQKKAGIGLALSGGGFRAMLFHLENIWRLNELGFLPKLKEITCLCRLKDDEIKKLFPKKEDKKKLLKLLEIVNDFSSQNKKVTKLKDNVEDVAVKLIKLIV